MSGADQTNAWNSTQSAQPPPVPVQALQYETPGSYAFAEYGIAWEPGGVLVVPTRCDLPPVCVKCGQPGVKQYRRTFYWLHPAFLLLFLVAWVVLLIVYLILRKRGDISLWLCEDHRRKRNTALTIAWVIAGSGMALLIASVAWLATSLRGDEGPGFAGLSLSIVLMLAGLIYGNFGARIVWPKKIDDHRMWLKGVKTLG